MQDNQDNKKTSSHDDNSQKSEKNRGGLGFIGKKAMSSEQKKSDASPNPKQGKTLSFLQSHPISSVNTVTPCFSSTLFNSMAFIPWLFLAAILIAQTIFTLDVRNLWAPNEIRYAAVFESMLKSNHWFLLTINQNTYTDTPPLYFIVMRGLNLLLHQEGTFLFFLTTAASGLAYLWSTLILGRFIGRMDGRSLLAGGIILLSSCGIMGALHLVGMELLFSAFIMLSLCAFFVALAKPCSYIFMVIGFFSAGLAYLTGGALGIVLPSLTLLLFLFWCKKITRLFQLDTLIGFIVFLAIIGAWIFSVFTETKNFQFLLTDILEQQIIQKAITAFSLQNDWSFYLAWLPCIVLPWIPLVFCLPWYKLFSKDMWQAIIATQKPEKEGTAFLWCIIIVFTLFLSSLAHKNLLLYLPAIAALSLLAGQAVLKLSLRRTAFLRILLVLFFLGLAVTTVVFAFFLFGVIETPYWLLSSMPQWKLPMFSSLYLLAALFLIIAFALWLIPRKTSSESILLIIAIGAVAVSFSFFKAAAPNFDAVFSPKEQANLIKTYTEQGYYPASLGIPDEMYAYYSQVNFHQLSSQNMVNELIRAKEHVVISMSVPMYEQWQEIPACIEEVQKQWIANQQYILLACPRSASIEGKIQNIENVQQKNTPLLETKEPMSIDAKKDELQSEETSESDTMERSQR